MPMGALENISNLKNFGNNIAIYASLALEKGGGHAFSITFDTDGNVILHEPHNSENEQKMTVEEFLKLSPGISFIVL